MQHQIQRTQNSRTSHPRLPAGKLIPQAGKSLTQITTHGKPSAIAGSIVIRGESVEIREAIAEVFDENQRVAGEECELRA